MIATADIQKDELVAEYTGTRMTKKELDVLIETQEGTRVEFIMDLSKTLVIDPIHTSSIIKFINHDTHPNTAAIMCRIGSRRSVVIETSRGIKAGEELTLQYSRDYNPHFQDDPWVLRQFLKSAYRRLGKLRMDEFSFACARTILDKMRIDVGKEVRLDKSSVFVNHCCGTGKLLLHCAMSTSCQVVGTTKFDRDKQVFTLLVRDLTNFVSDEGVRDSLNNIKLANEVPNNVTHLLLSDTNTDHPDRHEHLKTVCEIPTLKMIGTYFREDIPGFSRCFQHKLNQVPNRRTFYVHVRQSMVENSSF